MSSDRTLLDGAFWEDHKAVDVKTESKILLSALAAAPGGAGLVLVISGEATPYGWLLIALSLIFLIWLWKPWKWFQKKEDHGHKDHGHK